MVDKKMIIDFINYGIIAGFFLITPYSTSWFLVIIISLIFDFIMLYIVERKESENGRVKKTNWDFNR